MSFTFRLPKVVQEVGVILNQVPEHRFNYTMLLKILYLADRESLAEVGHPISGDIHVAMPRGPVLSRVCDLIRQTNYVSEEQSEYWSKFFETKRKELVLKASPGTDHLSKYEIEKLQTLTAKHKKTLLGKMLDFVGDLPEVKKNKRGSSRKAIPLEDILVAVGREDSIAEIRQNQAEDEFLAKILGD
ncbi:MAG: hypothetical protein AMXMBFR82_03070 [Candidatus Hydrogenedentota bacterium]